MVGSCMFYNVVVPNYFLLLGKVVYQSIKEWASEAFCFRSLGIELLGTYTILYLQL